MIRSTGGFAGGNDHSLDLKVLLVLSLRPFVLRRLDYASPQRAATETCIDFTRLGGSCKSRHEAPRPEASNSSRDYANLVNPLLRPSISSARKTHEDEAGRAPGTINLSTCAIPIRGD